MKTIYSRAEKKRFGTKIARRIVNFLCLFSVFCFPPAFLYDNSYAQDPLNYLKEETLSYFKPLRGKVISVKGNVVDVDLGKNSGLRKGMRFSVLREGAAFIHPVTREPIGKVESSIGNAAVKDVDIGGSTMEVIKGDAREGDIVRISEMKIRVMFYQDRNVDWSLADAYYNMLKESGRFAFIDTSLDSGDDSVILAEAKRLGAQIALVLRAETAGKDSILKQRLLWSEDSSELADIEVKADIAVVKDIRFGEAFTPQTTAGDALLFFDLPFGATLVTAGDVDGDGKQELIIGTGREIGVYVPGVSLHRLYEIKGSINDDYLRVDALDINSDGRDEIIATSMRDGDIVSYIYELRGSEFSLLLKDNLFLRKLGNDLIAQKYDRSIGFDGPVFSVVHSNGKLKSSATLRLPNGINIYDFVILNVPDGADNILAYDDAGFLVHYNKDGLKVWQSRENYGGYSAGFKKSSPTIMVDRGEWTIKDRLFLKNKEAVVVKRIPLADMAKGLGYKSSQVRALWWTGLSMEERTLISDISGGIIDYSLIGDNLVVLSKPLFGIKPRNILKGENPLGSMLYIYSLKGR